MWFTFAEADMLCVDNVQLSATVVPEPASLLVWSSLIGLGLIVAGRRRKKA